MQFVDVHFDFVLRHLVSIVFITCLIEAAGVPFPSRLFLLIAATLTPEPLALGRLAAVAAVGFLIGDHVPYLVGALSGPRILRLYCRVTLGSEDCVQKTIGYFTRFGAAAILLARFSTGVRLFAAALSGCGHIAYWRFLAFDVVGTVVYCALWVTVGRLVGASAAEFLGRHASTRLLIFVGPLAIAGLLGYRLYRRSRHGAAKAEALREGSACVAADRSLR